MNREQPSTSPQCQIHKKPALFVNTNNIQPLIQQEFPCEKCFGEYFFSNSNHQNNNRNENLINQIKINMKKLQVFEQMLIFYEHNLQTEIQLIQNFIKDFLILLDSLQYKVFQNEEELHQSEDDVKMVQKYISNKLSDLSSASNINNFNIILNLKQKKHISDTLLQNLRNSNQQLQQEFDLIPLTSIEHNTQCQVIAFSYNSKIMAAGCYNLIKIFAFEEEILNEITILEKHTKNVSCIQFSKSNKEFVSGSMDGQLIFWNVNDNQKWFKFQTIKDSEYSITCIEFNKKQNIFISGGVDCSVRFYSQSSQNKWYQFRQIICSSYVLDLCLDNIYKTLFICEYNNIVSVVNKDRKKQNWSLQQQINIDIKIFKIKSLRNKNFALLSQKDHSVYIFKEEEQRGFIKIQQINLQFENFEDTTFFMQLLDNYSIGDSLLVCGGQQFHIINKNNNFFEAITYKTQAIINYVRVSEDRKYLSYCEKQSNKIHIMRMKIRQLH